MRYDTPVYFQKIKPGEYDPDTGNYGDDSIVETKRYASVTDTDDETLRIIYGKIIQGSVTIQLQNHYTKPFDSIRIGNMIYRVDSSRTLRMKHIFVVSGVK